MTNICHLCVMALFSGISKTRVVCRSAHTSFVCDSCTSACSSCTPAFQAPEQLARMTDATAMQPFTGDVWALGCVLYCFIFGRCIAEAGGGYAAISAGSNYFSVMCACAWGCSHHL